MRFEDPLEEIQFQRLLADHAFESSDPRFIILEEVGRSDVFVEGTALISFDPDTNEIARNIMALLQSVERLVTQKLLSDLTLELDAMGSIVGHVVRPLEAQPTGQTLGPLLSASTAPLHFAGFFLPRN